MMRLVDSVMHLLHMSCILSKPAFCICEKKGADQMRSNCAADQHLCFHYTLYFLNQKLQIPSQLLWLYSPDCVIPGRKPRKQVFSGRCSYLF